MNNKWIKPEGGNFVEILEPLSEKDITKISKIEGIDRVQFSPPVERFNDTFQLLNEHLFSKKPDIGFRIYGNREEFTDLSFLKYLSNVQRLDIDEWLLIDIAPTSSLTKLKELSIGETKSSRLSYLPLADLKMLTKLTITGTKKNMEAISTLKNLQTLKLRSVSLDSLDILLPLVSLKELRIILGGIRNFQAFPQIGKLEILELCWINELPEESLLPIAKMPYLNTLYLDRLSKISSIGWLNRSKSLQSLYLIELNTLNSIQGVENIRSLEKLVIATNAKNKSIEPILASKGLKELLIPLTWGRERILVIDRRYPHLKLAEYVEEVEEKILNYKANTKPKSIFSLFKINRNP